MSGRTALGIAAAAAAGVAAYAKWIRPRQLTWGARPEEVDRSLPGDDLVVRPTFNATRGISIQAPPEQVWPWLVQVGVGRAGWYSYDLLDNLGRRSSRRIIPELQHLAPGDIVPVGPGGQGLPVHALDPPRTMILGRPGDSSWVWQLDPGPDGSTRLICRIRSRIRRHRPQCSSVCSSRSPTSGCSARCSSICGHEPKATSTRRHRQGPGPKGPVRADVAGRGTR